MKRLPFLTLAAAAPLTPLLNARIVAADESMSSSLLRWARALVWELAPENNVYGSHPTYVEWKDPATGRAARNRSVCSSFASRLIEHSFGFTPHDVGAWFGAAVPQAVDYHATIAAQRGFKLVAGVGSIEPGDIIGIAYPAGSRPTGHVMIAASRAVERAPGEPLQPETRQYALDVIDCAASGHGPEDTRLRGDGARTTGVGQGTLRLYARGDGAIAGYSWSTSSRSLFRSADLRRPAIGRLDPATITTREPVQPSSNTTGGAPFNGDDAPSDER